MKRLLFSLPIIAASAFFLCAQTPESAYKAIYAAYDSATPESYHMDVTGEIVAKQIATIPANQRLASVDKIALVFYFKKGHQPKLIVKNVNQFYQGMFSIFLPQLEATGVYAILSEGKSYADFSKRYTITEAKTTAAGMDVTLRLKGEPNDEYAVFSIPKESGLIESAVYYKGKTKVMTASIAYTAVDEYSLPLRIDYKNDKTGAEAINSSIIFRNHRIVALDNEIFR